MDYKLLKLLCCSGGISGDESSIREIILNEISGCADSIEVDSMGNILVFKKGKNRSKTKLLISAHMDEVGFIVSHITPDGYIKVEKVGGIENAVAAGTRVKIGKRINGVFCMKPIHLSSASEKDTIPTLQNMYIDIGANNKDDALLYVQLGDSVTFVNDYAETEKTVISKALDDRLGCLALINMIRSEQLFDMYFSFVVQEEVGLRGARTAAFSVSPQAAIVIESTTAADIHGASDENKVCCVGSGAVISIMDKATIYDREYVRFAYNNANDKGIPVQYKQAVAGGNDAGAIHISKGGVRTLGVSVPCRYLHSAAGLIAKSDFAAVCDVVQEVSAAICSGIL